MKFPNVGADVAVRIPEEFVERIEFGAVAVYVRAPEKLFVFVKVLAVYVFAIVDEPWMKALIVESPPTQTPLIE